MPAPNQPHIELVITNAVPSAVARNEIWRAEALAGPYLRINSNVAVNATFRDYQIAWGKTYWYIVRAIGTNGTFADSAASSMVNAWAPNWSWLSEPDGSNPVWLRWKPQITEHVEVMGETMSFDGRELPLNFAGDQYLENWDMGFRINTSVDSSDQWAALRYLIVVRRGRTLMFRDPLGNIVYGVVRAGDHTFLPVARADVHFNFIRSDVSVAV